MKRPAWQCHFGVIASHSHAEINTIASAAATNLILNSTGGIGVLQQAGTSVAYWNSVGFAPQNGNAYTLGGSGSRFKEIHGVDVVTYDASMLIKSGVALNNGGANTGTFTNSLASGDPTKWIPINDNGATR